MRTLALVAALTLVGCTPAAVDGTTALYQPDGAFFDAPWPSDGRVTEDGAPRWTDFPNPEGIGLLDTYAAVGERRAGHAQTAPLYLPLSGPLDPDRLLALLPDAAASLSPTSPLQLLDVDPRSPTFGTRYPLTATWFPDPGTYLPGNLLAVAPLPGAVLPRETTFALVATTRLLAPNPTFDEALRTADDLAPLRDALPFLDLLTADQIAVATVFTTGRPLDLLDRVATFLHERVAPADFRPTLEPIIDYDRFEVHRTDYLTPNFLSGTAPYMGSGGAFLLRDDGLPLVQEWEPMRLALTLPRTTEAPAEGWPVAIYLHGTGGHWRTFCNSSSDFEVANWLSEAGVVGLGIDLPLHGARAAGDVDISLASFNVLQPDAALHTHRQAAADLLYLAASLAEAPPTFTTSDGRSIPLDTSRLVVIGHSQGALTASLAGPWLGEHVDGMVLSGGGGQLGITTVERDSDFDIPGLLRSLLQFEDDETLSEHHPVVGMVQALVEPTDPIVYAPYWAARTATTAEDGRVGLGTVPTLMINGLRDDQTPFRTATALGLAAELPFLGTRYGAADGHALRGLVDQPLPATATAVDADGQAYAGGMWQSRDGDHFVMFSDEATRDLARSFVQTTLDGSPAFDPGAVPSMEAP